jgi:RHS repeat-associated protein
VKPKQTQTTTTTFFYDGDALLAEFDGAGHYLRRYVHGPGADEPLVWFEGAGISATYARYLLADRQGSVIGYSDSTGTVSSSAAVYAYDAYGLPASWGGSRFRYTGQIEIPEAQLYHYRARVYDPVMGHFLQTDPVGYKDQLDLYAYVGDDPMDRSDPTGLYDCTASKTDCTKVARAISNAKYAMNSQHTLTKSQKAELAKIDAYLGKAGDHNGVYISTGTHDKNELGSTSVSSDGKTANINLDMQQIDRTATRNHTGSIELTGVIFHETTHGYDQRNGPIPDTFADRLKAEQHAYGVQANLLNALGYFPLGYSTRDIAAWVQGGAGQSAGSGCIKDPNCRGPND